MRGVDEVSEKLRSKVDLDAARSTPEYPSPWFSSEGSYIIMVISVNG
jgi:hypothetical protein